MSNTQLQQEEFFEDSNLENSQLDAIHIPSTSNKESNTEIPNDPVVIMQVLQVMDRERERELKNFVENREEVKDAVESTISKIMNIDSGFIGMLRVAIKGRSIPKDLGAELDILLEYEAYLTQHIDKMVEVIQNSRKLALKADTDPDRKNRLILRQRAVADLDNIRQESKLADLRDRCAILLEDVKKDKPAT